MELIINKIEKLTGQIEIPGSKSHTIRAVVIASLANGTSKIINPLFSDDTKAAINGCKALGAKIKQQGNLILIEGFNAKPQEPKEKLDMLNSGTSINMLTSIAALGNFKVTLDGDNSLRKRPLQPLLGALENLGVSAKSINNNNCPPIEIQGPIKGGKTEVDCKSSQYVSSLLISCPLIEKDTEIIVKNLCEIPYIKMTLKWLDDFNIKYENKNLEYFKIYGNQKYNSFEKSIPADWSSAAFPICAAAITQSDVLIKGPDINDTQGDKKIIDYLKKMGADINLEEKGIRVKGKELKGCEIDLNKTPDLLPIMAVVACFAKGETKLTNVAHARIKETDRIKVMHDELKKMNADITELKDGLVIRHKTLKGASLTGHSDHRVVMALSLAGLIAEGKTVIDTAESVSVTYPNYFETMKALGANFGVG
jgi:3-phosphoshikimate 1-carboxyvinyltransferase|tara:strand:- start:15002 stop:16273 length:1272 start_codon:yes stop_codon:yes gene_type:complete